ncbi:NADH-quinone oxidoreductase subunit J [Effusibacillus lacus]|uniref:NADH-quinone oxidoreductase subunit J n=1 Tax=Effusibacillus lacus TaxID=1348429 RepID=A0A292YIA0_9BACL|nr:NADH-quinone oxidoreductase subunit J [Effusibacillus lacus]TCS71815.1 NADH dehydrogenase subunit J [Effusibacillus lacus]GAX89618.1 NADH:ubiquinone oxidoreductase subunit J [Effusibacillus lacus]
MALPVFTGQMIAFILISLLVIGSAVAMLFARKVIYMALLIGGVFIGVAGIYILLDADFVGFAQVLIYAGAITILMLFAIMLTNHGSQEQTPVNTHSVMAGLAAGGLLALLYWGFNSVDWTNWQQISPKDPVPPWGDSSVKAVGDAVYNVYAIPFELVSVVLIVALVGAIILARKGEE